MIVETKEVSHDIDLVVDVILSALQVDKTAAVDSDANADRAVSDESCESSLHPRDFDQELPLFPFASVRRWNDGDRQLIGIRQPERVRCELCAVLRGAKNVALVRALPAKLANSLACRVHAGDHLLSHFGEASQPWGDRAWHYLVSRTEHHHLGHGRRLEVAFLVSMTPLASV